MAFGWSIRVVWAIGEFGQFQPTPQSSPVKGEEEKLADITIPQA
jgi:hypothetical protein